MGDRAVKGATVKDSWILLIAVLSDDIQWKQ